MQPSTPASLTSSLAAAPLLRLLQLCSPALPIGAFAYSQGLEPAVASGWVRDEATARAWILGLLTGSLGALELPVLARLHAAWGAGDDVAGLDVRRWSAFLRASRPSAELQAEDRHLARALARVIEDQGAPGAGRFADDPQATYAAVFARAASAWGIPVDATVAGFAFAWVEAQFELFEKFTRPHVELFPINQPREKDGLAVGEDVFGDG